MSTADQSADVLGLSDEDILNMVEAPRSGEPEAVEPETETTEITETSEAEVTEDDSDDLSSESDADREHAALSGPDEPEATGADADPDEDEDNAEEAGSGDEDAGPSADASPDEDSAEGQDEESLKSEEPAVDYKAAYERLMGPIKANGKEIKLESVDEAIQLIQMGANYTKKLQALQPNLKMIRMLENNNLLDEGKISYLIDLDKKNPEAIKKLLKDSGMDPLDIDTSEEPQYTPGNHKVTDQEMQFNTVLEDVTSSPEGKQTIVLINKQWDTESKKALWKEPGIMQLINEHRTSGIYDQISAEVERQKTLGHFQNTPFLQAYQNVGIALQQAGRLNLDQGSAQGASEGTPTAQPQQMNRVVETRAATPKKVVNHDNNSKARAASPVKAAPKKVVQDFNPLSMSDEEFEKASALSGRL